MSVELDLKALWNKQTTGDKPDMKELLAKADQIKKNARNKLIRLNLILLATIVFMTWVGYNIDNIQVTTKIGLGLVFIAIITYLMVYNQLMPLLLRSDPMADSHAYLEQLIAIKRKHDFLNKVMINIYFTLLSVGMFLYMLQFTMHATVLGIVLSYGITFGWIFFAWFYLRPKGIKKKQQPLIDMIAKLEKVNGQLVDGD